MEFLQYFGGNAFSRYVARKVNRKLLHLLVDTWSQDSINDIATNLLYGKPRNSGSNTGRSRTLPHVVQLAIFWSPRVLCRGKGVRNVKLTIHLHLVPRLRIIGIIPTLSRILAMSGGVTLLRTENYRGSYMKREDNIQIVLWDSPVWCKIELRVTKYRVRV
jgi:hypothetical protein